MPSLGRQHFNSRGFFQYSTCTCSCTREQHQAPQVLFRSKEGGAPAVVALVHKEQPRGGAPRALPGGLRAVRRGAEHGLQVHARQRVARIPPEGRGPGAPLDGGAGAAQLLLPAAVAF